MSYLSIGIFFDLLAVVMFGWYLKLNPRGRRQPTIERLILFSFISDNPIAWLARLLFVVGTGLIGFSIRLIVFGADPL